MDSVDSVCLPVPCVNEEFGVPRYDCLFEKAAEVATTEYLMFSNSDMLYFDVLALFFFWFSTP